mmetsp:Transcript_174164/g.423704  ORF Transcript_174164/g.423704 Transcript_174164/m.423704 type:complete len:223 (-) Transcript_174164:59-727(-)
MPVSIRAPDSPLASHMLISARIARDILPPRSLACCSPTVCSSGRMRLLYSALRRCAIFAITSMTSVRRMWITLAASVLRRRPFSGRASGRVSMCMNMLSATLTKRSTYSCITSSSPKRLARMRNGTVPTRPKSGSLRQILPSRSIVIRPWRTVRRGCLERAMKKSKSRLLYPCREACLITGSMTTPTGTCGMDSSVWMILHTMYSRATSFAWFSMSEKISVL